ncbi:MAG: diguanylate cyclase [Oscillospiraceae bacterium]
MKNRKGLTAFLFICIPLAFVAIFVAAAFHSYSVCIQNERERTYEVFSDTSTASKIHVIDNLDKMISETKSTGHIISHLGTKREDVLLCFQYQYENSEAEAGLYFSDDGTLKYGDAEYGRLFSSFAASAAASGKSAISDLVVCLDGVVRFAVAVPLVTPTEKACIALVYPRSTLEKLVDVPVFGDVGGLCIISESGEYIACPPSALLWKGFEAAPPAAVLSAQDKVVEFISPTDNTEYIAFSKSLGINDWLLVCSAPLELVASRAGSAISVSHTLGVVSVILVVLTFAVSYMIYRHRKRQITLTRRRFKLVTTQSSRAAFEYNRNTDKFRFISSCKNIRLPQGVKNVSLTDLLSYVFPADRLDAKCAVTSLHSPGTITVTVRVSGLADINSYRWYYITATRLMTKGQGSGLTVGSVEDIDEREKERLSLREKATTDSLTGLCNRAETERIINERLSKFGEADMSTFSIIDIDNFKQVNDCFGHDCGDKALIFFADKLRTAFRFGDVLGRLGGDEFVVYMTFTSDQISVERRFHELMSGLFARSNDIDSALPDITCSIGYVTAKQGDTFEVLYKRADAALYSAKENGRNTTYYGK